MAGVTLHAPDSGRLIGRAMYSVKEIFYTLQGEGAQAGRPAVFCRFAGCNLWTGRERDRATATCNFCDTDFVGTDGPDGGKFAVAGALAKACRGVWRGNSRHAALRRAHRRRADVASGRAVDRGAACGRL